MVSRRKILSRSRDDLHLDGPVPNSEQEEEDIWYIEEPDGYVLNLKTDNDENIKIHSIGV